MDILSRIYVRGWSNLAYDIASWHFKGHPRSMTLADPIHTYSGYFGAFCCCFFGVETEHVIFSHRYVNSASLHCPMSFRPIDTVCSQAILPMKVTLFSSGILCVTDITSIKCKEYSFCSELNENTLGKYLCHYDLCFLRYSDVKLKNCRFRKNLSFGLS